MSLRIPEWVNPNSSNGMVNRESDRISVERISAKVVARRIAEQATKKRKDLEKHAIFRGIWDQKLTTSPTDCRQTAIGVNVLSSSSWKVNDGLTGRRNPRGPCPAV